jgi:hypothetical protein
VREFSVFGCSDPEVLELCGDATSRHADLAGSQHKIDGEGSSANEGERRDQDRDPSRLRLSRGNKIR